MSQEGADQSQSQVLSRNDSVVGGGPVAERDEKIKDLEAQLAASEAQLKAKTASFDDQLAKEHAKAKEREAKDAQKREEMNQEIIRLKEEKSSLSAKVQKLQECEAELEITKSNLEEKKKEIAKVRVSHNEEKSSIQFQLDDRRRTADRQQQEVSDLKCQISILEHKLGHATSKQNQAEAQIDEMAKLQLQVQSLNERLSANDRVHTTELTRHQRDRRSLEEKVQKLTEELNAERMPPTKTQVVEKYETVLARKNELLRTAVQLATRPGGPVPPLRGSEEDSEVVQAFFDKMRDYINATEQQARAAALSSGNSDRVGKKKESEFKKMNEALEKVPPTTRQQLIRRFQDCAEANIASSRRFGDTSGFPTSSEDPAVLVNHIANLTAQRDSLQEQLNDANGSSPARTQRGGSTGAVNGNSPNQKPGSPQIIKISMTAPANKRTGSPRSPSRGTDNTPSSAKKKLRM